MKVGKMMIIPFNKPVLAENAKRYMEDVLSTGIARGDGDYCLKCQEWIKQRTKTDCVLLTPSCSAALELAALLCDIKPGDEVIMPSYTFCSTANAFALRGARIVFVDIRQDTMNIDEKLIEPAITSMTKAIVVVHYGGISCEMDMIIDIARRNNLLVVEDAAQGVMAKYKGRPLGTIGDFGCYSFHETKNYSMGEGGAIIVNRSELKERAEIIREKGTNRSQFLRGQVDKYTWVDIGSSFLPSDFAAANLYAQLEIADEINDDRRHSWELYYSLLEKLADKGKIELPTVPENCFHNAHLFYIKTADINERTELIAYLKANNIISLFHYVPLHSSIAGRRYGMFNGNDLFTTKESERLLRLPMYYKLGDDNIKTIVEAIKRFYDR